MEVGLKRLINTQLTVLETEVGPLVYASHLMTQLLDLVEKVSQSQANVMILGEPGTGKSIVSRQIHSLGEGHSSPFVSLNCAQLQDQLIEMELFGHEEGAFTGAFGKRLGLLDVARQGTLYLDQVDQLSPVIQKKLLQFLNEGRFYSIGGHQAMESQPRIISSSSSDIEKLVLRGSFNEDLYYRLNTVVLSVPPLRRRAEDVEVLATHFIKNGVHTYLNNSLTIDLEVMEILKKHNWPGNVYELKSFCERMLILCEDSRVKISDLPMNIKNPGQYDFITDFDPEVSLHEIEKRYITKALNYYDGNKTKASKALGVTVKTLYNKLHQYGIFKEFAK